LDKVGEKHNPRLLNALDQWLSKKFVPIVSWLFVSTIATTYGPVGGARESLFIEVPFVYKLCGFRLAVSGSCP